MNSDPTASQDAVPEINVVTKYAVEGQNVFGKWETWVITDSGKNLNPADSFEDAEKIKGELDDYRASEKTGWCDSRIVEVVTTRRVLTKTSLRVPNRGGVFRRIAAACIDGIDEPTVKRPLKIAFLAHALDLSHGAEALEFAAGTLRRWIDEPFSIEAVIAGGMRGRAASHGSRHIVVAEDRSSLAGSDV